MDFAAFFAFPGDDVPPEPQADGALPAEMILLPEQTEDEWARLFRYTEQRRFRPGDALIQLGEVERAIYILAEGVVEVLVPDSAGAVRRVTTAEPGAVIGEISFFDSSPRSATVRALTEGEVRVLSFEAFEVFATHEPALARALLLDLGRIIAWRMRRNEAEARAAASR